jgi:Cell division protein
MARGKQPFRWGVLISGLFLGVVAGLVMAIVVAWQLGGDSVMEVIEGKSKTITTQSGRVKTDDAEKEKTSFDFYTVLPEGTPQQPQGNATVTPKAPTAATTTTRGETTAIAPLPEASQTKPPETGAPTTSTKEIYWLQVGSFSRIEDAESRRAELALSGWEATIQKGEVPGRGTIYRVRLGPYDNPEHTGRMRAELSRRNFEVAIVRQ